MLLAALVFIPVAMAYKPKEYLQDEAGRQGNRGLGIQPLKFPERPVDTAWPIPGLVPVPFRSFYTIFKLMYAVFETGGKQYRASSRATSSKWKCTRQRGWRAR